MAETIDHMRGRLCGIDAAQAIVWDVVDFDMVPDASAAVVRRIRYRLSDALKAARASTLMDIRFAKMKAKKRPTPRADASDDSGKGGA